MGDIETGGRAFPWCGDLNDCPTINLGMSLRDYFAAKAMQAMLDGALKGNLFQTVFRIAVGKGMTTDQYIASKAYEQADAMIKARES